MDKKRINNIPCPKYTTTLHFYITLHWTAQKPHVTQALHSMRIVTRTRVECTSSDHTVGPSLHCIRGGMCMFTITYPSDEDLLTLLNPLMMY